jgi:two-component system, cell cycle sensor histidine kinase and response regulator CckA
MDKSLRVLHLEDDPDFAELVEAMLGREGVRTTTVVVSDLADFVAALERDQFDIILADYGLPSCNGMQALEVARNKYPHVPFLLVSGTIDEEAAIGSLRKGVTDYVLKLWPERLVPAVRRAVHEAQERAQRELAEVALVRRERYFQALTENSLDVLTILTREGEFQYNSPSLRHVLGYEPEELIGRNVFELVHPDDLQSTLRVFEQALQHPELRLTLELRYRRKDKTWCYLEIVGQNRLEDPEIAGMVLNTRDITERKQAEARLRLQSAALESAANAIMITDRAGSVIWANSAFTRLTGYSMTEVLGSNPRFLNSGHHDRAFYQDLWDTILACRVWQAEMVNRHKDGSLHTEETTITPVRDEQGQITHFVAVKQDVTARKQAERALIESERRFSVFMDHLPVSASIKDQAGNLVFANRFLQDLFGWTDWRGRSMAELLPAAVAKRMTEEDRKALTGGLIVVEETITDARLRERAFESYKFPISVQGEATLLGTLSVDITERRELESQLRQAQKMEAIGQLAGGVAHDFNNLLTVIRGNTELALMDGKQVSDRARQCLKQVTLAAERSANLVRQLLTFSRKNVMRSQALNLNEVIANMTKMLIRIIGENYELQCAADPLVPLIQADAGMLEQVLVNLVVNSRDAMPDGGQLVITTQATDIDESYVHAHPGARVGKFVCLRVQDSGTGISPEHLPRLFEPFFTTKGVGKGTGLGLATAYGIIKQHQGWIEVSSRVGEGTTFTIYLPVLSESASPNPLGSVESTPKGGSEGILVVEDDEAVRSLTRQVLAAAGYRVWEAACAREAMVLWRKHSGEIDLLLTDIVMPDLVNGLELAEQLRGEQSRLKVLVMSGYSPDSTCSARNSYQWAKSHFLEKPFAPAVLLRALRRCLDEGRQAPASFPTSSGLNGLRETAGAVIRLEPANRD